MSFVFLVPPSLLVQGARCAGIHKLVREGDTDKWQTLGKTKQRWEQLIKLMKRFQKHTGIRTRAKPQTIIPESSCPWILCHWSASKAQRQRSSGSVQKAPAGCQPASRPWRGDWTKCGWPRHWEWTALGSWKSRERTAGSAAPPPSLTRWRQAAEGCCQPSQCCLRCCCCYCCCCWPWRWRGGAGQSRSGAGGPAGPEESAAAPAPAVWARCTWRPSPKPPSATPSPSPCPSSALCGGSETTLLPGREHEGRAVRNMALQILELHAANMLVTLQQADPEVFSLSTAVLRFHNLIVFQDVDVFLISVPTEFTSTLYTLFLFLHHYILHRAFKYSLMYVIVVTHKCRPFHT